MKKVWLQASKQLITTLTSRVTENKTAYLTIFNNISILLKGCSLFYFTFYTCTLIPCNVYEHQVLN